MLTDSGGFQMVSLAKLLDLSEEGVTFESPVDGSKMLLTPEESMRIQNSIGADIMMVLDDVVSSTCPDKARVREATERTIRWLDRCVSAHNRRMDQNLFAIVQGGLHADLRAWSLMETLKRDVPGYAIGGLSGGEGKQEFWRVVSQCTGGLPKLKPRYLMGVGYPLDILCCVCLGVDMFDCVYPTRTARFGTALTMKGQMRLTLSQYKIDSRPIEADCQCRVCHQMKMSRAYLHLTAGKESVASRLISEHNVFFMLRLMNEIRRSISAGTLEEFACNFLLGMYPKTRPVRPPVWVRDCLVEGAGFESVTALYDWEDPNVTNGSDNPHVDSD